MALYKLISKANNFKDAKIVSAESCKIEKESHIEDWIEKHPFCLGLGELMIIHRQAVAKKEETTLYPDLLAIDEFGFLYVIELKKGRTPREIIAQSLEYASWLGSLERETIVSMAESYLNSKNEKDSFRNNFLNYFEMDDLPEIKQKIKIILVAEDISSRIIEVSNYLQRQYKMEILPVEIMLYNTGDNEYLIETNTIGRDIGTNFEEISSDRWNNTKSATEVVHEAVLEFTGGDKSRIFKYNDIRTIVLRDYPGFNSKTIRCNLYSNCVNHPSRKHYSGKLDYYNYVQKGEFSLFKDETKLKKAS